MEWTKAQAALTLAGGVALAAVVRPLARTSSPYPDAASAIDALIAGNAPDAAREALRSHLMWIEPERVVRRLADLGYVIEVNERPRDGHWFLPAEVDYHGGFAVAGRRLIVVSEEIRAPGGGFWFPNRQFDEAVDHEIGHALDADAQGSMGVDFLRAWQADFGEIPVDVTTSYTHDGKFDPFRYFVYSDGGGYSRARQETFAEAYVVLLKGDSRNAAAFRRFFPRTLAAERVILERRYGPLFRPAA